MQQRDLALLVKIKSIVYDANGVGNLFLSFFFFLEPATFGIFDFADRIIVKSAEIS